MYPHPGQRTARTSSASSPWFRDGPGRPSSTTERDEVLAARCPGCGYTYEVDRGDEHEGFAAGTAWSDVPQSWCCPDCGVREKADFVAVEPATFPELAS